MQEEKTVIQFIKAAAHQIKGSKLKGLSVASVTTELDGVVNGTGLQNREQAILFVSLFEYSFLNQEASLSDLCIYFNCSIMDITDYLKELDNMVQGGFINKTEGDHLDVIYQRYVVNHDVLLAIVANNAIEPCLHRPESTIDKYEFCKLVSQLVGDRKVTYSSTRSYVLQKEKACNTLKFIKDVVSEISTIEDRILYYDMCYDFLGPENRGYGKTEIKRTLTTMFDYTSQRIACNKALIDGSHPLIMAHLIMYSDASNTFMTLTHQGIRLFVDEDITFFTQSYNDLDRYTFIQAIFDYLKSDFFNKESSFAMFDLKHKVLEIEQTNSQLQFIAPLSAKIPDVVDRTLFYVFCQLFIKREPLDLYNCLHFIYKEREINNKMRLFKNGKHILLITKILALNSETGFFGTNTTLKYSCGGKKLFFEEDADLYDDDEAKRHIIIPSEINAKHLYFNQELNKQLLMVQNSLEEEAYRCLVDRLQISKLSEGIAILMYGGPGTGKTESVLQIARATGREIMKVDISETKSAWFGESEKIIKKVFTEYNSLCEKSSKTPILFFNEADAIFSKRQTIGMGNMVKTENAIQNVILEELEGLKGILIATTNLANNMDAAFERRFLFKIGFDKPTLETKQKIWMDKMPQLSPTVAYELAKHYDFSGGEIDNVVRKVVMREVISGEKPTVDVLMDFCRNEKINKKETPARIGFRE